MQPCHSPQLLICNLQFSSIFPVVAVGNLFGCSVCLIIHNVAKLGDWQAQSAEVPTHVFRHVQHQQPGLGALLHSAAEVVHNEVEMKSFEMTLPRFRSNVRRASKLFRMAIRAEPLNFTFYFSYASFLLRSMQLSEFYPKNKMMARNLMKSSMHLIRVAKARLRRLCRRGLILQAEMKHVVSKFARIHHEDNDLLFHTMVVPKCSL